GALFVAKSSPEDKRFLVKGLGARVASPELLDVSEAVQGDCQAVLVSQPALQMQALRQQVRSAIRLPGVERQHSEIAQHHRGAARVSQVPVQRERLLVERRGALRTALVKDDIRETVEAARQPG